MDFKKIAGEIGSRLDSLEIFLRGPNYPSIPKAAQHTISPVAPQEPLQSPSGPTSQPSQSLSATNIQPPPYSLTAKDEPQSTSAAPSEPPPYSSIAPDEPQSSSAATSEPPKSPPDHASQSSRSSESLEIVPAPRLAGNTVLGPRHMNVADLGRFSPVLPSLRVEGGQTDGEQLQIGQLARNCGR